MLDLLITEVATNYKMTSHQRIVPQDLAVVAEVAAAFFDNNLFWRLWTTQAFPIINGISGCAAYGQSALDSYISFP